MHQSPNKPLLLSRPIVLSFCLAAAFLAILCNGNHAIDEDHDHSDDFPGNKSDCKVRVVDVIPKNFSDFGKTSVGTARNVTFVLDFTCPGVEPHIDDLILHAHVDNDWVACIKYTSPLKASHNHKNKTMPPVLVDVNLVGSFVGFANIDLQLTSSFDKAGEGVVSKTIYSYPVAIHRDETNVKVDTIFIYVVSVLVIINNVIMGCQLDLAVIWQTLKKPLGPLVGFVCQFLIMPVLSFSAALTLLPDGLTRLGLFTLGCSPGGANSNFWTILFDGDINLSVTMTAISTIAAMGMMPLWLTTVSPWLYGSEEQYTPTVPILNLVMSICSLTIPLVAGVVLARWTPKAKKISSYVIKPFTLILVAFVLTVGVYSNSYVFKLLTGQMLLAGFLVSILGFILGALGAFIARLPMAQIKAVSIETALQNAGIAMIVLKLSLPRPGSDIAVAAPTAQLLMTGPPLWIALLVLKAARYWRGKATAGDEGEAAAENGEGVKAETDGVTTTSDGKNSKNDENGVSNNKDAIVNPAFQLDEGDEGVQCGIKGKGACACKGVP